LRQIPESPTQPAGIASRNICDVDSLAAQHDGLIALAAQVRGSVATTDTGATPPHIDNLQTEIDGQYRTVVAACRAFIQCMEMNSYDEGACRVSQMRWSESERNYNQLAIRLREIAASAHEKREHHSSGSDCDPNCKPTSGGYSSCCPPG
jgi:hypothetical protein